jgi:sec-independent protein translocase protein TatC
MAENEVQDPDSEPEKPEQADQPNEAAEPKTTASSKALADGVEAHAGSGRMSFGDHLVELRRRMFKSLLVVGGMFLGGWTFFSDQLTWFFMRPHHQAVQALAKQDPPILIDERLQVLSPLEDLFFTLKASLLLSALIGLPFLIYQIWAFVSVGLHSNERKAVRRFLPWSMIMALGGLAFCYLVFFPLILEFLYGRLDQSQFSAGYRLEYYFHLYLMFTFALVLIFQLPLLLMGLAAGGLVDAKTLRKYRRHFILGAFVVGAMLTPPEPYSQFLMAMPTIVLFEIGVLMVSLQDRRKASK